MPRRIDRPADKIPWGRTIPYTSPTGKETTLYNIGAMAEAIGRTSQTVRKWEVAGTIPPTPFKQGLRRLYCREQIDAMIRCVEKYHVTMGNQISPAFSKAIYREFKKINEEFFGKGGGKSGVQEKERET